VSRTEQSDAIQEAFLDALRAEGAVVEDMKQVAARTIDPVARGLFEHLGRARRNVFFVKSVGLINLHVRSEARGWWDILKSVKEDLDWLRKDFRVNRYFVLLIGHKDQYFDANGYIASDFNGPPFVKHPGIEATKFTINEKQHLDPDARLLSVSKIAKVLLALRKVSEAT
jgi:hypothetical protein